MVIPSIINVEQIECLVPNAFEHFATSVRASASLKDQADRHMYAIYLSCQTIDACANRVALVTMQPIDALPAVKLHYDRPRFLPSTNAAQRITVSPSDFRMAVQYTFRIVAYLCYRQSFEATTLPYLLLPALTEADRVDWDEIRHSVALPPLTEIRLLDNFPMDRHVSLADFSGRALFEGSQYWTEKALIPLQLRHDVQLDQPLTDATTLTKVDLTKGKYSKVQQATLDLTSPLWEMRCVPSATNLLRTTATVLLTRYCTLPRLCGMGALSASMVCSARLLPSILTAYEQVLLARQFRDRVLGAEVAIEEFRLIQALTTPSAQLGNDYQQIEFLGDCLLKLIASCWAYCQNGAADEGDLTKTRQSKICNLHLCQIGKDWQVAHHAMGMDAVLKHWLPHGLARRQIRVSSKMYADMVEAILGAAWLSWPDRGPENALATAIAVFNRLGILAEPISWASFVAQNLANHKSMTLPIGAATLLAHVGRMEEAIGHSFRYPRLAMQALTHSSSPKTMPSYERLEFLGDAVLDVFIVQMIHAAFPTLNEGQMTKCKGEVASNASLGVLCMTTTKLHDLLLHDSDAIAANIDRFRADIKALQRNNGQAKQDDKQATGGSQTLHVAHAAWKQLDVPKQLADMVESCIGAVFVDCDFDLEQCRPTFDRLCRGHVQHYLDSIDPTLW